MNIKNKSLKINRKIGRKTQSKPAPTIHVQMDYKNCKILFFFKSRIQWLHVEKDHVCSFAGFNHGTDEHIGLIFGDHSVGSEGESPSRDSDKSKA